MRQKYIFIALTFVGYHQGIALGNKSSRGLYEAYKFQN
jgi:hypothetical protein